MFAELIGTYPMKVMSTDRGVRVLHAKDPDSKANAKSKAKYMLGRDCWSEQLLLSVSPLYISSFPNRGFLLGL